jgi:hypothetical protein
MQKATIWIRINLWCVRLNNCGLFSTKHNGMAVINILVVLFTARFSFYKDLPKVIIRGEKVSGKDWETEWQTCTKSSKITKWQWRIVGGRVRTLAKAAGAVLGARTVPQIASLQDFWKAHAVTGVAIQVCRNRRQKELGRGRSDDATKHRKNFSLRKPTCISRWKLWPQRLWKSLYSTEGFAECTRKGSRVPGSSHGQSSSSLHAANNVLTSHLWERIFLRVYSTWQESNAAKPCTDPP